MYQESRVLDEMDELNYKVYINEKYTIFSIPNFTNNPCFAVFIGDNEDVARISLLEPKYVECEYENYRLNKEDIKEILHILSISANDLLFKKDLTVWQILLIEQNRELEGEVDNNGNPFPHIDENLPIPDYYQLLNS